MNQEQWEKHALRAQQQDSDRGDRLVLFVCMVIALMLAAGAAVGWFGAELPR